VVTKRALDTTDGKKRKKWRALVLGEKKIRTLKHVLKDMGGLDLLKRKRG